MIRNHLILFYATGCHVKGPIALRPRLSPGLPIYLLQLFNLCKKNHSIILWCSTVHKKNITVLTFKNKKRTVDIYIDLFSYFRSPRSIDITVSYSFVFRSFLILKISSCSSVKFSELPSWKSCDNGTPKAAQFFQVWSATAGFPAPWSSPVATVKFPTVEIIVFTDITLFT